MKGSSWDSFFEWLARASPGETKGFNRPPDLDRALGILARLECRQVLVVGPGPGEVPGVLAERGLEVVAFDLSPVALRWGGQHTVTQAGPRSVVGDAASLPLSSASFDGAVVLTVLSLYETDTRHRMAGELARVVAPGGIVLCWHNIRAFPEYRRAKCEGGTLSPLYQELRAPYPGFASFHQYFDEEGNRLGGVEPPSHARFWCSRTLGGEEG